MEPIKINIEVNLGNATLEVLRTFAQGVTGHPTNEATKSEPAEAQPEKKAEKKAQPKPAPEPAPVPEAPKTTGANPVGTGAEDDDDLPPADGPAPSMPTEHDARLAVKAAKERKVTASAIKAFMKDTFGIATSVECPAERRQELIDGLNKLTA